MSEQEKNQNQNQEKQATEEEGKIELDAETYQALLDKLDDLEDQLDKGRDPIKDLADEGRGGQRQEQRQQVDLDSLSQSQLAEYIIGQLGERYVHPVAVAVESLRFEQEVDRLNEDERKVYDEKMDDIFKELQDNPKMSLKKAVKLFKPSKEESEQPGPKKERDAKLRHLPRPQPIGEKPGAPAGQLDKETPKDRRSAAEIAIDELGIKFHS